MEYKWDKKLLLSMLKSKETRKDLKNLLKISSGKFYDEENAESQIIENDIDILSEMPSIKKYIETFYQSNIIDLKSTYEPEKRIFSKKEALDIAKDYFKTCGTNFYDLFLETLTNSNLTFKKPDNSNSETIICPSNNQIFIKVNFDGSIHSLINLIHEISHAIGYKLHPYEYRNEINDYFSEIESSFHTLLFLDFLTERYGNIPDIENEKQRIINETFFDTEFINNKFKIITVYQNSNYSKDQINIEDFKSKISSIYNISPEDIDELFSKSSKETLYYLIGNYVGMGLYNIYKESPNYGFFLYKAISLINSASVEEHFRQIENAGIDIGNGFSLYQSKTSR